MKKLLLSARDPGAAGNISVLYEDLLKTGRFDIVLVASGAAWAMLSQKGHNPHFFEISGNRDHIDPSGSDKSLLLEKTQEILKTVRPDAVITGLSSFGAGIDEAIAFLADVPVFAVQDFWGDVNLSLGKPADLYLVLDEFAAEITKKRCGAETKIIGSPKYSRYAAIDIEGMRREARLFLDASDDDRIIGWFGQHPDIPGYSEVFGSFMQASEYLANCIIIFREHPKFGENGSRNTALLCSKGIRAINVTGLGCAEQWISACDLLVTPFSLCGLDHAYLSAFSEKPLGNVIYLMHNNLIKNFFHETSGIERIPVVNRGVGKWLSSGNTYDVLNEIKYHLGQIPIISYHEASKKLADVYPGSSGLVDVISSLI